VDASPVFPEFEGLVYLVGPSLGGLLTTLLVEETAEVFDGGLATCGPIGSFRRQVNYWGDLLVVFDYFFPQFELLNPPSEVPPTQADVALVREDILGVWGEGDGGLGGAVRAALEASPETAQDIATVVRVATDRTGNESVAETVFQVLEAAVLITNDGIATLGGNPFGNERRVYLVSDDDLALNLGAKRYEANPNALATIAALYETSGTLGAPLVTLHNLLDHRIPYWHELIYRRKVRLQGSGAQHTNVPVFRFGHCNFEQAEALAAFALLVLQVDGLDITLDIARALVEPEALERFWAFADRIGLVP
jgi:hypothetical protein